MSSGGHWAALARTRSSHQRQIPRFHILDWDEPAVPPEHPVTQMEPMNISAEMALLAVPWVPKPSGELSHRDGWDKRLVLVPHSRAPSPPHRAAPAKMGMTAAQFRCRKTLT